MMNNQQTKRPQNKCGSCGYTWYPKGSNLSRKCPSCGSNKTQKVGLGVIGILLCLIIIAANNKNSNTENSASLNSNSTIPPEVVNANKPTFENTSSPPPISEHQQLDNESSSIDNQYKKDSIDEKTSEEALSTDNNQPTTPEHAKETQRPEKSDSSIAPPQADKMCPIPGHC